MIWLSSLLGGEQEASVMYQWRVLLSHLITLCKDVQGFGIENDSYADQIPHQESQASLELNS